MTSHTISSPRLPGGNTELRCPHNKSQRHSAAPTKERYMEWSHRSDNSTPSGRLLAPVSRARSEERDRHTLQADDRVCGRYCFSQVYWFCVRSVTSSRGKSEENRKAISHLISRRRLTGKCLFIVLKRKCQSPSCMSYFTALLMP